MWWGVYVRCAWRLQISLPRYLPQGTGSMAAPSGRPRGYVSVVLCERGIMLVYAIVLDGAMEQKLVALKLDHRHSFFFVKASLQ